MALLLFKLINLWRHNCTALLIRHYTIHIIIFAASLEDWLPANYLVSRMRGWRFLFTLRDSALKRYFLFHWIAPDMVILPSSTIAEARARYCNK